MGQVIVALLDAYDLSLETAFLETAKLAGEFILRQQITSGDKAQWTNTRLRE